MQNTHIFLIGLNSFEMNDINTCIFSGRVVKILLFNTTGDRDNTQLLAPLMVKYSF